MVHLGAGFETRILGLPEVAHHNAALEIRTRPEMRVRADAHLLFDGRALERGVLDFAALTHRGVAQDRVRAYA